MSYKFLQNVAINSFLQPPIFFISFDKTLNWKTVVSNVWWRGLTSFTIVFDSQDLNDKHWIRLGVNIPTKPSWVGKLLKYSIGNIHLMTLYWIYLFSFCPLSCQINSKVSSIYLMIIEFQSSRLNNDQSECPWYMTVVFLFVCIAMCGYDASIYAKAINSTKELQRIFVEHW